MYKVTTDIVLDDEINEQPIDVVYTITPEAAARAAFVSKMEQKYKTVKVYFTNERPNGNFEVVIVTNRLSDMLDFLTKEITGDIDQSLYHMVTQINNA